MHTATVSFVAWRYVFLALETLSLCLSTSTPGGENSSAPGGMAPSATALDFREMLRKERELALKNAMKGDSASSTPSEGCVSVLFALYVLD